MNKKNIITFLILKFFTPICIFGLIMIWLIRESSKEHIDPMDDSYLKDYEFVTTANATDSNTNGFEVVYFTANPVTKERAEEIRSRQHLKDAIYRLEQDAPKHFGDMLHTDIFDFAVYAIDRIPDKDIKIDLISDIGYDKIALYEAPNPNIPDCPTRISRLLLQGNQCIKGSDAYRYKKHRSKIYRYWKCYGLNSSSSHDERFIHFSKKEAIN